MNATAAPLPPTRCAHCALPPASDLAWRCDCGGPFEYDWRPTFDPARIVQADWSQWRYGHLFMPPGVPAALWTSLGEGMTPLVTLEWQGHPLAVKLDFLMPTASYKDRGTSTLVSVLRAQGHRRVVEDSSGNAGASLAAYAAHAGIEATIFVPADAATGKKRQIATFGATLEEIYGPRQATSDACHAAARDRIYASHAWHPAFLLGQMAAAWELWERGTLPEAILMPVGQGGMLLGYFRGLQALREAALIPRLPRLITVQSEACDPVVVAWERGHTDVEPVETGETVAAGIRIRQPARGREILRALRESNGLALRVSDEEIRRSHRALARRGLFVERTSAVPVAALPQVQLALGEKAELMVPLSGSGLKEEQAG